MGILDILKELLGMVFLFWSKAHSRISERTKRKDGSLLLL